MNRIALIEDDVGLGDQLRRQLSERGFAVSWLRRGDDALVRDLSQIDLVLLDLGLPGADGLVVLDAVRRRLDVPVIVVTARNAPAGIVAALDRGADDYLTKPFSPDELVARMRSRLRRPVLARDRRLGFGALVIDLDERNATVAGVDCALTRVEHAVLVILARRPNAVVARGEIVRRALEPHTYGGERTLDVHVSRLRKKLGGEGERIETVRGIGYRLRGAA